MPYNLYIKYVFFIVSKKEFTCPIGGVNGTIDI